LRVAVALVLASAVPGLAENVDPTGAGLHFAWAECVGWISAEPDPAGEQGLEVGDFELSGWLWGENVGWISLSCVNTASCPRVDYRVRNDGRGALAGWAWGENVGWINFRPGSTGVTIDRATGRFGGYAWGENIGWISFASARESEVAWGIESEWTCDPIPAAPGSWTALRVARAAEPAGAVVTWDVLPGAGGYDVARGDLARLLTSGGDFALAADACLVAKTASIEHVDLAVPLAGNGFWYVARGASCGGDGTYDSGAASQRAGRDAGLGQAASACWATGAWGGATGSVPSTGAPGKLHHQTVDPRTR
jgi:hypothetical protein